MKRLSALTAVTSLAAVASLTLVGPADATAGHADHRQADHHARHHGHGHHHGHEHGHGHGHGHGHHGHHGGHHHGSLAELLRRLATQRLEPRTHFEMQPDGSSGLRPDGAGIPNIDSVKSTIRTYYNATDGIADKDDSPYISEMHRLLNRLERKLPHLYRHASHGGDQPAIVFDADDTTLWTYDMEDGAMKFDYDPDLQDDWVQEMKFPATPGMVDFVHEAQDAGFAVFGLTGRHDSQKAATIGNLDKVGYDGAFDADNFYTKFDSGAAVPDYLDCAGVTSCTTVEYKAGTRKHIESMGYDIALNLGDQWSDLQGGYADRTVKLPNPTYYLPSPNLPGVDEPWLSPRTRFWMEPDGSSGERPDGEGIPNIDSVKSTIRTYYNATDGIADKGDSPYITELTRKTQWISPVLDRACGTADRWGLNPAIVLDADDTTLWTYDMEDGAMHFNYDPGLQDVWVQGRMFPATPGMVALANAAEDAGCTLIGLTGRNDDQKTATLDNLDDVGYDGFTSPNYYTKWTGVGSSQQPAYITCAEPKCTTIEYKSQTRAHVESPSGGDYTILANFGDQFSDLIGGHALVPVKMPNPTYYLP